MIIRENDVILKNGAAAVLRSPQPSDAEQLNAYLRLTSGETHFMVRYPEECNQSVEAAQKRLQAMADDERNFMLAAFLDGELVGNCGVNAMAPKDRFKMRHRAGLGISIRKKAWGLGLGTILITRALEQAKENGFTQVELGVFADNDRARHLYQKLGFEEMGCIPKAFYLKDGTYRDEVQMIKFLTA